MRTLQRLAATVGVAAIGLLGFQSVAGADAGYPGGTNPGGSSNVAGPSQAVGTSFSGTLCGFAPGTPVTLILNGTSVESVSAGANGCITFTGAVTDPHLSINGLTPIAVSTGAQEITATGTSSNGGTQTDTYTFTITTAAAAASGLAFTGADIAGMSIAGLALIAVGLLAVRVARRRTLAH